MEVAVTIAPNKRQDTETDYQLRIICQVCTHNEPFVENPQVQSMETVLSLSRRRHIQDVERTEDITASAIQALGGSYHRSCYKEYSNKDKLARATRRYQKALKHKKVLQSKIGRPSFSGPSIAEEGEGFVRVLVSLIQIYASYVKSQVAGSITLY